MTMNVPALPPGQYITTSRASYDVGFVPAGNESEAKLAAGMYSLSSRSNVPYISLSGSAGFRKVVTWGEIFEVPQGQSCNIKNESAHGGDIFINSGCDYDNRPARITVPATIVPVTIFGNDFWMTEDPVDVRMARRAFFTIDGNVDTIAGLELNISIAGYRTDGSHYTDSEIAASGGILPSPDGVGYVTRYVMTAGEYLGNIPLGQGCILGSDPTPHVLLTMARFYMYPAANFRTTLGPPNLYNAYYSLEY